jgi:hypothetical protein
VEPSISRGKKAKASATSEVSTSRQVSIIAGEASNSLEIAKMHFSLTATKYAPRLLMSDALRDILDLDIGVFWPTGRGDVAEIRSSHASSYHIKRRLHVIRMGTFDLILPRGTAA